MIRTQVFSAGRRPVDSRASWLLRVFSGLLLLVLGPRAGAVPDTPRPLSEAERQGVVLALDYFEHGMEAWWVALDSDSPLRALEPDAARRELEVRAGPVAGSTWRLQTLDKVVAATHAVFSVEYASGVDERLDLELRDDPDWGWRLVSVRSLADPPAPPDAELASQPGSPVPDPPARDSRVPASRPTLFASALPLGAGSALAAVLLTIAAVVFRRRRGPAVALAAGALALAVAAGALLVSALREAPGLDRPAPESSPRAVPRVAELGALLPLRRQLAAGGTAAALFAAAPGTDVAGTVARLWQAQRSLTEGDPAVARSLLQSVPIAGSPPLADLLRGRLGALSGDEAEAVIGYERAEAVGLSHDGLWLEAAQALFVAGFEGRAHEYLERCAAIGSRDADTYYLLSAVDVYDGREDEAVEHFVTGWKLLAQERRDLFRQPAASALMDRPEVVDLLALSSAEEPRAPAPPSSARALDLPASAKAQVASSMLRVEMAGATLLVPGGAELAPPGVKVVDGGAWQRLEEEAVLAELSSLRTASDSALLTRSRLRHRLETAARALGRSQRWEALLGLTAALARTPQTAPSEPLRWRALALERSGRGEEARDLLVTLARRNLAQQVREPGTLFQLADLLAQGGEYDLAVRLATRAGSQLPLFAGEQRLRRYRMDQRLAGSYEVYRSRHFEVRYPRDRSSFLAKRLANLMEEERRRLLRWIPAGETPVEVHLIPYEEFLGAFGGRIDILGLYDGKIRVPMADVASFQPEIVAILSHELAHAMIADATGDLAPRWFHEGLAQHVEMISASANPMPDYDRAGGLLSLPVLEAVLAGFTHPRLVAQSYDQAAWTLHYLESRHGLEAIRHLQAAFGQGLSTEEAVASVLGRSLPELDADLRRWWIEAAPAAWKTEVRRYELRPDNSIHF